MAFFKIKSYAKVNMALNIIGKSSSLHKIESIVALISLYDEIFIKEIKSGKHIILFSGKFSKNIGKNNTISNILDLLEKKKLLKNKKFQIKIKKKIPNEAGLGGGSMNAANILRYFIKKKIIKAPKQELIKISKLIGSDVILGLNHANSIITSNNEIKYFYDCKTLYTLIVKPNFGCSTKEIYKKVGVFSKPRFGNPNKKMFDIGYLKKCENSLEKIAFSKYHKLKTLKLYLESLFKPAFVRMTGSGSALVAYFQSRKRCEKAKNQFIKKYKNYWCITSKTI